MHKKCRETETVHESSSFAVRVWPSLLLEFFKEAIPHFITIVDFQNEFDVIIMQINGGVFNR